MTSSEIPAWIQSLEGMIEEEKEDEFGDPVPREIIRDLLLAPYEDDLTNNLAIDRAVQHFESDYLAGFAREETDDDIKLRQPPEYDAGLYLNEIAHVVFGCMETVPFGNPAHDRLAGFLIALKQKDSEFDRRNPKFVYHDWALEEAAQRSVAARTDGLTQDGDGATAEQTAQRWVNASALVAKLYQAGCLHDYGGLWVSGDFEFAFETREDGDVATNVGRQAQVLVPANHMLLAGEALLKEFQGPTKVKARGLDKEKWGLWAGKLQEVASAVQEDAPWDLKSRAQKAHDKMVDLWPEAFQ